MSVNGGKADIIVGKADISDSMSAFGVIADVIRVKADIAPARGIVIRQ